MKDLKEVQAKAQGEHKTELRVTGGSRTMMLNFSFSFVSVLSRSTRKSGKQTRTLHLNI